LESHGHVIRELENGYLEIDFNIFTAGALAQLASMGASPLFRYFKMIFRNLHDFKLTLNVEFTFLIMYFYTQL